MSILLNPGHDEHSWLAALRAQLPELRIHLWPDVPNPETVEFVVATRHEPADLLRYPNLRAVLALGAGVEQFIGPEMPAVPIVRLAEPFMYDEMAAYVVHWVVHFQKRMDAYLANQASAVWRPEDYATSDEYPIAILGFGRIGERIGRALSDLGFPINAWSRAGTTVEWATSFAGLAELPACLGSSAAIVNVLPDTAATRRVLDGGRFAECRPGALFINLGRGTTVDETALLAALEMGQIGAAVLDVADPEPMESTNPLWRHPRTRITPHVAGYTIVGQAVGVVAANIRRMLAGEDPFPIVDLDRGY